MMIKEIIAVLLIIFILLVAENHSWSWRKFKYYQTASHPSEDQYAKIEANRQMRKVYEK